MSDQSLSKSLEGGYQRVDILCDVDGVKTTGFVLRRDLTRSERMARALRMFGILFGVGCFTIFIPILHFILPPLFLILAVVFATTTWLETGEVLRGEINCPNCQKTMQITKEAEDWPKIQRCGGCSYTLKVVRV